MKYCFVFFALISLFLAGCDSDAGKQQESAAKNYPSAFINEKAVWEGNLDKCFGDNSEDKCLINEIGKSGSPEALKSVQYLAENGESGYVKKFTKEGHVGIAEVEYPFRANTNSGILLIPSSGQVIDVDNFHDKINDPAWIAFEKMHPESSPWPPATLRKKVQTDNEINFIFSYPVKTCHACDDTGTLYISYNFTGDGKYLNYKVVEIK